MRVLHNDGTYMFFVSEEERTNLLGSSLETDLLDEDSREKTGKRIYLGIASTVRDCVMVTEPQDANNWEEIRRIGVIVDRGVYSRWEGATLQLRPSYGHIYLIPSRQPTH